MNFLGIVLTLACALYVFMAPRRRAVLGVLAAVCYITQGQQLDVGGFHFTSIRIVLLVGFIRLLARGELQSLKVNQIDCAVLAFTLFSAVVTSMRVGLWQEQVGTVYNVLLSYYVFRGLLLSWEDVEELVPSLAVLIIPLTLCMLYEARSGNNFFNIMGGQPEEWVREGRYRCIGSFRSPHTAGIFGATLMPLFVGLFLLDRRRRGLAITGFMAATLMTYTANSSGPLLAYLCCLVGLGLWRMRTNMRMVRRGLVAGLILLACTMKAPIWYVFAKISDITGGDGWYRSYLMEQCFNHISDWWLAGTDNTGEWGATQMSWGGADLCNIYVSCAAGAGLLSLFVYILIEVWCFRDLGRGLAAARKTSSPGEMIIWCLGTAFFAHVVALFSITYFDQIGTPWWGLIGTISSVSATIRSEQQVGEVNIVQDEPIVGESLVPGYITSASSPNQLDNPAESASK